MKPLKSLSYFLGGTPGWAGISIDVFHDKVRHLVFGGEVVVNLRNSWGTVITDCLFVDILLCLVLGVQRNMAFILNEIQLEDYALSEVVIPRVQVFAMFFRAY